MRDSLLFTDDCDEMYNGCVPKRNRSCQLSERSSYVLVFSVGRLHSIQNVLLCRVLVLHQNNQCPAHDVRYGYAVLSRLRFLPFYFAFT